MFEIAGDIWDFESAVIVVPTNGFVKKNGRNVMGAGLARQALERYPNLDSVLGTAISNGGGNHVHVIRHNIVSFPTKEHWVNDSDLVLIARSAEELRTIMDRHPAWTRVAMPRVGCGNGNLRWTQVKPIIQDVFGDDPRIWIVDR